MESKLKIKVMRRYLVLIDGYVRIVRIEECKGSGKRMWCVLEFGGGMIWCVGSKNSCKKFITDNIPAFIYGMEG